MNHKELSTGQYYKNVPTNLADNVRWRCDILAACEESEAARKKVLRLCSQDIVFFAMLFVWQINPKKKTATDRVGPFVPYEYQIETMLARPTPDDPENYGIIWCYENDKTAVMQKSRQMGASWWFLIFQIWLCRFEKYMKCLNISRNAEAVDDSSSDSLFFKVRFIHERIPGWVLGTIVDKQMYFKYEASQSSNTGSATVAAAGVGGNAGVIFIDEYPRIKDDKAIRSGTASTANARFFNGTHQGTATEFYRLTQTPEVVQFVWHWSRHPEYSKGLYRWNQVKNRPDIIDTSYEFPPDYHFDTSGKPEGGPFPGLRSPWYDNKVLVDIGDDVEAAQELDINPSGSVSQFFESMVIRNLVREFCRKPSWEGDFVRDGNNFHLEEKGDGPLKLWIRPDHKGQFARGIYKVGCDLSTGVGKTNSCISIVNASTGERIGEYVTPHVYPDRLAPIAVWICKLFCDQEGQEAELIWEAPGPGKIFGDEVIKLGFRRFYRNDTSDMFDIRKPRTPGWQPERKAKKQVLGEYKIALRDRFFLNRSELALEECLLFRLSPDGNKVYHDGELDKRDPSGAGENHGDRCFVAGTMITTEFGDWPIETIQAGQRVMTRKGWKVVSMAGPTGEAVVWKVEFGSGRILIGTGNHPVWVKGKGWVSLSSLTLSDRLVLCQEYTARTLEPRPLFSMGSGITEILTRLAGICDFIIGAIPETRGQRSLSTSPSGRFIMGLCRKANSSITLMRILSTMTSAIWRALTGQSMARSTRLVGISLIEDSPRATSTSAYDAARTTSRSERARQSIVHRLARRLTSAFTSFITSKHPVSCAAKSSPETSELETKQYPVLESVAVCSIPEIIGSSMVYNLSVIDEPEYFANGVLVHNCIADALAWKLAKAHAREVALAREDEGPPVLSLAWRREMRRLREQEVEV